MNPLKLRWVDWKEKTPKRLLTKEMLEYLESFAHSSLIDLSKDTTRREREILSPSDFPKYFLKQEHLNEIRSWLEYEQ